ncbi:MAG TPA: sigma-70 family RNA polymerase sigma factor [Gaiellaceae bacterium]|nr:sigma-70 family RNA polymerase sigma factor [Gaiellaceae bacterium]
MAGARRELDRLYRAYRDEVVRYARVVLRSPADAEDVAQTTFIRALRALERGEQVARPRNWLIKIAHNECRRLLQTRQRRNVEVELTDVPVEQAQSGRADELRRALSQLAPHQREALVLRELEGRSYAEIASALDLSESAVETLIFRARRALREQLDEAVGCDEAATLLQADVLSLDERRRLRAHTRACAHCATLERRARGRKSALRRIASSLGLPWWGSGGGKVALLALGVGTAATTFGLAVAKPHAHPVSPPAAVARHVTAVRVGDPAAPAAPARVRMSAAPVHVVRRHAHRRAASVARPRASAATVPVHPRRPHVDGSTAGAVAAPQDAAAQQHATPATADAAASAAARSARSAGVLATAVRTAPVERAKLTVPRVSVPAVAVPSVAAPSVTAPTVSTPAVALPGAGAEPAVTVPSATTPAVTTPSVSTPPLATPAVTVAVTLPTSPPLGP